MALREVSIADMRSAAPPALEHRRHCRAASALLGPALLLGRRLFGFMWGLIAAATAVKQENAPTLTSAARTAAGAGLDAPTHRALVHSRFTRLLAGRDR